MRATLHCFLFLAAMVASCVLLERGFDFPDDPMVRAKIDHLAQHGDEYDVLFIGSSHVHLQFMPSVFDRVAAMERVPVKSFNAGLRGMFSPEDGYVLEQILRGPHRRLRWVFLELNAFDTEIHYENTLRFAYWHDNVRLGFLARSLIAEAAAQMAKEQGTVGAAYRAWKTVRERVWAHLHAWLLRAISMGRGLEALNHWLRVPGWYLDTRAGLGVNGDGWEPKAPSAQEMTPADRTNYERAYASFLAAPPAKFYGDAVCQAVLDRSLAAIAQAGARPILVLAPMIAPRKFYPAPEREAALPIFDFLDARQYPQLYTPEHHSDTSHLNIAGSEIFSDLLARRFVEVAKDHALTP